jgi:hypothetical protein
VSGPAARKRRLIILCAVGGTALILLVLGILALAGGGGDAPPRPPAPAPGAAPKRDDAAPPAAAAETRRVADVPREKRPSDPIGGARWDAEAPGAGASQKLAFADLAYERADQLDAEGRKDEAAGLRKEALAAYADVIRTERDQERARDRLGYVKFDPAEAKRLAALPYLSRKLQGSITEVIEQVEEKTKGKQVPWPLWMNVKTGAFEDVAGDWRKALRAAKELEAIELAKGSDPFYQKAKNLAAAVEGDVGPVLRRKNLEGPAFDAFPRKPYVVIVQRDADYDTKDVGERWGEVLMQLRETFLARFRKLDLPPMDRPTPLLLLRYDTDYVKYLRRGDTEGRPSTMTTSDAHFEPFSKRLVTWKDPDGRGTNTPRVVSEEEVRTILFHEGTHQLVDYYTKTRASNLDESLWFSEGIADYFGGHGRSWDETSGRWRYEPGLINVERVARVGDAKAGNFLFKIRDLLAYRRRDYEREKESNQPKTATAYAQGWALVYLLSNWNDQKYRERFDAYVKRELNGESGVAAFEAVFGADSIDGIEKDLHEMIDVLYQASKEKRIVNGKLIK